MTDNSDAIKIRKFSLNSDSVFKLISGPVPRFSSLSADRGLMQLKLPNQNHLSRYCYRKMHGLNQEIETAVPNAAHAAGIRAGGRVWDTPTVTVTTLACTPLCGALLGTHDCPLHTWMCPFHHTGIPSHSTDQLSSSQVVRFALQRSSMALEQSHGSLCSADSPLLLLLLLLPFLIFPVCALEGK